MMKLELREINASATSSLTYPAGGGENLEKRESAKEDRMSGMKKTVLLSVVALLLAAAPTSASIGIDPSGMLDPVDVVAEIPEHLNGLMDEVVVEAEGPLLMLDEVEVVAEGPRMVLDEVEVVAEAPDTESRHVFRVVMHDAEFTLEHIN